MPSKFLTASIVALFCCAVSFLAFADPPDGGAASASVTDAGPDIAAEVAPDPGPSASAPATQPAVAPDAATWPGGPDELVEAFRSGDWRLVAAFALIALMIGLRRVREFVPQLRGDRGGAILVMLLSLAGALSTSLATDAPVDAKMFLSAVAITWTAVGGYTWIKRLIWPKPEAEAGPDGIPKAQVIQ